VVQALVVQHIKSFKKGLDRIKEEEKKKGWDAPNLDFAVTL